MKKHSVLVALFVAALVFVFPFGTYAVDEPSSGGSHNHSGVSSESADGVNKDQPEKKLIYSGVACGYYVVLDEIACGLFPLKQAIALLKRNYIEQLELRKLVETAVTAGVKHINEFLYQEYNVKNLDVPFQSVQGINEDFNLDDWQMERATFMLRHLAQKLTEARPAVEKMGPRAFELLLKETRDAALLALMETLDPHSAYYPLSVKRLEDSFQAQKDFGEGGTKSGGIGASLRLYGSVYVAMPFPNTPAGRQLQRYDEILVVDEKPVATLEDARALRGPVGSSVELVIRRNGLKMGVIMTREKLSGVSVAGMLYRIGDTNICYLMIGGFAEKTGEETRVVLDRAGVCGVSDALVLDLRGNDGGFGDSAIEVAQAILPKQDVSLSPEMLIKMHAYGNHIVKSVPRDPAKAMHQWKYPIVILQDGASASASELLIGMLRPYAVLIGDRTFGKFSGLMRYILADGSFLVVAESSVSFKNGPGPEGKGFDPDIYFSRETFKPSALQENVKREEDLPRHRGGVPMYSDDEKLLKFISEHDPEFGIALGLLRYPEKLSNIMKESEKKGEIK